MSFNPLSASRLHPDDPFFRADGAQYSDRPSYMTELALNSAPGIYAPETCLALYARQFPQISSHPYCSHEITSACLGNDVPQMLGNPHWGLVSPPIEAGQIRRTYDDQRGWGLRASPSRGGGLAQMPNNRESNLVNSPSPREQVNALQPDSVKHLTCWYWANKGCKLPERDCLYSHYDTGRLAEPPVQVQRGREFSLALSLTWLRAFLPNLISKSPKSR